MDLFDDIVPMEKTQFEIFKEIVENPVIYYQSERYSINNQMICDRCKITESAIFYGHCILESDLCLLCYIIVSKYGKHGNSIPMLHQSIHPSTIKTISKDEQKKENHCYIF